MDTALKQRLIGAVVLVALAVIFLPMLVKGPAPDSATEPAPADGMLQPAATAGGNFAVSFGAYATQADADAVLARVKQGKLPGFVEPATINGKPAFRVRVGPYADRPLAEAARLDAIKIRGDVNAQVVTLDAETAAPAANPPAPASSASTAAAAPATSAVTTQALPPEPAKPTPKPAPTESKPVAATPAETRPVPPPASKPVVAAPKPTEAPKPAASGTGFAVQLGAFSNAADANALRDRARGAGFSAFVEQVRTDKGTLSRVRIGPVANRADADRLKAQVASKIGVDGMVRPHP
jgi:cell division septation protein DedD